MKSPQPKCGLKKNFEVLVTKKEEGMISVSLLSKFPKWYCLFFAIDVSWILVLRPLSFRCFLDIIWVESKRCMVNGVRLPWRYYFLRLFRWIRVKLHFPFKRPISYFRKKLIYGVNWRIAETMEGSPANSMTFHWRPLHKSFIQTMI